MKRYFKITKQSLKINIFPRLKNYSIFLISSCHGVKAEKLKFMAEAEQVFILKTCKLIKIELFTDRLRGFEIVLWRAQTGF